MIEFSAMTDKGLVRKTNQDYCLASNKPVPLFVLCDGMGGHSAGDIASKSAVQSIKKYVSVHYSFDTDEKKAKELLCGAVEYANKIVYSRAKKIPEYGDMGTTCDICFVDFDMLYVAHVGDSRVYLYRDGCLTQITTDHTLMEELLKKGSITKEEIENHPGKHMITRAVGTEEEIEVDFYATGLQDGDVILMCSDGLTNILSDNAIKKVLLPGGDINAVANQFIRKANEGGGVDNTTVIILKYTKNEEEEK